MIHVIWSNYDGTEAKEFEEYEEAERFIAVIVAKENSIDDYGTRLVKIIEGKEVTYKITETVAKVKIVPKGE